MRNRSFIFWLAPVVLLQFSCRTTERPDPPSTVKSQAVIDTDTRLELSKSAQEKLYQSMLKVEKDAGVDVQDGKLHSIKALVLCYRDGILRTCEHRVRLTNEQLAKGVNLDSHLAQAIIFPWLEAKRPDLSNERLTITSVVCDYIGKNSPPFTVEDVKCDFNNVRAENEIIYKGISAAELAEMLKSGVSLADTKITVRGAINCQWISSIESAACFIRTIDQGELSTEHQEISTKYAIPLTKSLMQGHKDLYSIQHPNKMRSYRAPSDILATAICEIDKLTMQLSDEDRYRCRINF